MIGMCEAQSAENTSDTSLHFRAKMLIGYESRRFIRVLVIWPLAECGFEAGGG